MRNDEAWWIWKTTKKQVWHLLKTNVNLAQHFSLLTDTEKKNIKLTIICTKPAVVCWFFTHMLYWRFYFHSWFLSNSYKKPWTYHKGVCYSSTRPLCVVMKKSKQTLIEGLDNMPLFCWWFWAILCKCFPFKLSYSCPLNYVHFS